MVSEFLSAARLRRWAVVPLGAMGLWLGMAGVQAALNLNGIRAYLGVDFTSFWVAGMLARHGAAASVYQGHVLGLAEQAVRAMPPGGVLPFYYPPPYLLLCLVLAWLPYWVAMAVFLTAGLVLLLVALRRLVPAGMGLVPTLAFPGFVVTARTGQNGMWCASCLAWFAVLADARPFLAGACLGALACKPQLAICAPFALVASGRWRSLAGAAVMYSALCGLSLAVLGPAPWRAFFQHAGEAKDTIAGGMLDQAKIMSAFVAARLLGAGLTVASVVQACVSVPVLAALVFFARQRPAGAALGGALAAAALLVTPYATDYDLICMAPALAVGAARRGLTAGDKILLIAAFLLPLVAHDLAYETGVQLAPVVLAGLLFVQVRTVAA